MTTVAALIDETHRRFSAAPLCYGHGTDNAWDEAVALVLGVTGAPDTRDSLGRAVSAGEAGRIRALAARRVAERVPLPYLLGRMSFAGREFVVTPEVVVPRSPLAHLIDAGLRPWRRGEPGAIADVCAGSGCLGILAAYRFPSARVTLVELDGAAARVAAQNVAAHGLGDRVTVVRSDLFERVPPGRFDVVLANPPYVDAADLAALPAEYRHEPAHGLAGGPDGLALVTRLLASLPERLADDGLLVCEVGASAPALLRRYPRAVFAWPDLPAGGEGVFVLEGRDLSSLA